jgi:hypothetical protein
MWRVYAMGWHATWSGSPAHLHFHLLATHIPLPIFHLPLTTLTIKITLHALTLMIPFDSLHLMLMLEAFQLEFQFTDFNLAFQIFDFITIIFIVMIIVVVMIMLILISMFTKNGMPLGPPFLFGDLAGFYCLLNPLANFMKFVFVVVRENKN